MAVGGSILEITYQHDTLGNGSIFPKADEDSTFDLGGLRSMDDEAMVDGAGNMIDTMEVKRWSFEVVVAWDANTREDLEKINALAASPVQANWTITSVNGTVYAGTGKPVGDLKGAGRTPTFPLKVSGGGKLEKIVG